MRTSRPLLTAILGLALAGGLFARDNDNRVEVKFLEPERFTDVRDSYTSTDYYRGYLADLEGYLKWRLPAALPPGHRLTITFTDIDLAGDFEPWRRGSWSDVRIVKRHYPARLKFTFELTDATGKVVKSGERELEDRDLVRLGLASETLRFEKGLLDDWIRSEFPRDRT